MPPGTHNALTRTNWAASGPTSSDLESLEAKVAQGINGDMGGCWCPSYYSIAFANTSGQPFGVVVTGPVVIWGPSASLTMTGNANYVFAAPGSFPVAPGNSIDNDPPDFPLLGVGHSGRTHVFAQDVLTSMTSPVYGAIINTRQMGLQAVSPTLVNPTSGAATPTVHVVPLFAHDGATLTGVTLSLIVPLNHATLPVNMPSVRIVVSDEWGTLLPLTSVAAGAIDSSGTYYLPAPASAVAWRNNGQPQVFTIPVDQNNVISNSTGLLYAIITDELDVQGFPFGATITAVDFATTGQVASLSGIANAVDGVTVGALARVLVKDQVDPCQNGVYEVVAGAWSRAKDSFTAAQCAQGQLVYVNGGAQNAGSLWQQETPNVSALTGFQSWASGATYKVGDGVSPISTSTNTFGVASIALSSGGSGYTAAPAVTISGSCTTQATAHANMAFSVTGTTGLQGGSGYSYPPIVTVVGGGPGTSATITATLGSLLYGVDSCTMTNFGEGYAIGSQVIPPVVTFGAPPFGTGHRVASGAAVISNVGTVAGILMLDPGAGYSSAPTVTITPQTVNGVVVGSGATATATLGGSGVGSVASLSISATSTNFTETPTLVFTPNTGGGSGAGAQAVLTGAVTDVTIDNAGAGYTATASAAITGGATLGTVTMTSPAVVVQSNRPTPGLYFVVSSIAGTGVSGGVQPAWPTQKGQSVIDDPSGGEITWTAQSDPGAQLTYGTTASMPYNPQSNTLVAYGTVFIGLELTYSDIVDCRWQ